MCISVEFFTKDITRYESCVRKVAHTRKTSHTNVCLHEHLTCLLPFMHVLLHKSHDTFHESTQPS